MFVLKSVLSGSGISGILVPMVDTTGLQIPPAVKDNFADLLELILASESMNMQERQYWINILPVMTEPQVDSLREILVNEKRQLAAIDAKYAKQIENIGKRQASQELEKRRTEQRSSLETNESKENSAEQALEQELLEKIDSF